MTEEHSLCIASEDGATPWRERFETANPFTGETVGTFADGAGEGVHDAVAAARDALDGEWSRLSGSEQTVLVFRRADIVDESATEQGRLKTQENGKLVKETTSQARVAARRYRYLAGVADTMFGEVIPLDHAGSLDFSQTNSAGSFALRN
jgi:aldehyde dehydrogenase (NAD+)